MGVLLARDRDSWSHTGIALSLWIGNMLLTISIYKVVFSRQRRQAFMTWLFVSTFIFQSFKIMTEFVISNEVFAIFTLLVIWVAALFCITKRLLCYYWGKHRRHFMWGGCLQVSKSTFFYWTGWFWSCLFLLTRQLMHIALSPWLHLLVRYMIIILKELKNLFFASSRTQALEIFIKTEN